MTLTYDGSVQGFKQVDMTSPTETNVNTGAFYMKDEDSNSFAVFCLDLLASVYSGQSYGYVETDTPFTNGGVDLTAVDAGSGLTGIDRIQKLFDSGFSTALSNVVNSAAFQMALWNAVYDVDWSVGDDASGTNGGVFYQTDTSNEDVRAAANAYLSAALAYTGGQNFALSFLQSTETPTRSQNLVSVSAMPIPAAGLMLLTAFGGLVVARRRKAA